MDSVISDRTRIKSAKILVAGGFGATLFAPSYMGGEIENGTLAAIPIEHNPFPMRQTFLVCIKEKMNRAERRFYDHVLSRASPHLS